jgi:hypothetical protein
MKPKDWLQPLTNPAGINMSLTLCYTRDVCNTSLFNTHQQVLLFHEANPWLQPPTTRYEHVTYTIVTLHVVGHPPAPPAPP